MAQILRWHGNYPAADASMKRGVWDKKSFMGEEIRGKVLGLAGLGRIGLAVARRARAFEMMVIAHDLRRAGSAEELGIAMVSLDDLCRAGGLPVAPSAVDADTRHIFNADRLARCKKDPHRQHRARRPDRRRRARGGDSDGPRRWAVPRSMSTKPSRRRTRRCRSCRRSWPVRILPRPRARARSWSAGHDLDAPRLPEGRRSATPSTSRPLPDKV